MNYKHASGGDVLAHDPCAALYSIILLLHVVCSCQDVCIDSLACG